MNGLINVSWRERANPWKVEFYVRSCNEESMDQRNCHTWERCESSISGAVEHDDHQARLMFLYLGV